GAHPLARPFSRDPLHEGWTHRGTRITLRSHRLSLKRPVGDGDSAPRISSPSMPESGRGRRSLAQDSRVVRRWHLGPGRRAPYLTRRRADFFGSANPREDVMSVARVSKITAASSSGFDDAVRTGLERASRTLRGITGLHVVEQKASVHNGRIS